MSSRLLRLRVEARGVVQGVGFRPFVHRLATELGLPGWVRNSAGGAEIEVEGSPEAIESFLIRLRADKPALAVYHGMEHAFLEPAGFADFRIRESDTAGSPSATVVPDIATCADCLREILDPADRRFRYPFANCTNCGPRFSILEALPYDRRNTTMRAFPLCSGCRAEYEDPRDRRFHAQPVACAACGPRLEFRKGTEGSFEEEALRAAASAVKSGGILAVKGLGGFQLICDARDGGAVRRLRERKGREEKPFAVMACSLEAARELCEIDPMEEALLDSPEAPIVLLRRRGGGVCDEVAPGNPMLGVLLPTTPLHHLLLRELGFPIVATSGNLSDEPICTGEAEAFERLGGVADAFLVHDRPIARHVDDSVARVIAGRVTLLRRARGYAPMPILLRTPLSPVLAAGAHGKNTVAITAAGGVVLSQHIGDLDTAAARQALDREARGLAALYDFRPAKVACDAHPGYASTAWARSLGLPVVPVQHHFAHVLACMAENEVPEPALGIAWDGAGWGPDGTIWGGEFLRVAGGAWERIAHLRAFGLPGGDRAAREPRRAALGIAFEIFGDAIPPEVERLFRPGELATLLGMLGGGVNTPRTSSAGRLFDAVAALAGLRAKSAYEGQAAMELEFAAEGGGTEEAYPLELDGAVLDWEPLLRALLDDVRKRLPVAFVAARFHSALALGMVAVARLAGLERVVLSGGCFQNSVLTRRAVAALERAGFKVFRHQRVPPNDGGIALGQAVAAGR